MKGSILVVEDHLPSARAIVRTLAPVGECVVAGTVAAALEELSTRVEPFCAIVVDLDLPDGSGFDVLAEVRRRTPDTAMLVLTGHVDGRHVNRSYGFRAEFLAKPAPREHLVWFARRAVARQVVIDDRVRGAISDLATELRLSRREIDVLTLGIAEYTRPELAGALGISENTVKSEIRKLLKKAGSPSIDALAKRIFRRALVR